MCNGIFTLKFPLSLMNAMKFHFTKNDHSAWLLVLWPRVVLLNLEFQELQTRTLFLVMTCPPNENNSF